MKKFLEITEGICNIRCEIEALAEKANEIFKEADNYKDEGDAYYLQNELDELAEKASEIETFMDENYPLPF